MSIWHNESGRPLASDAWLEAHHRAKLRERTAFARLIAARAPRRIVDLGCGPGLWLELLSNELGAHCELLGFDSDSDALQAARERAQTWAKPSAFESLDFELDSDALPEADTFLAFNVFPYVSNPTELLETLRSKLRPGGCVVVRQYDGALLRVGPMSNQDRQLIDMSLMASVVGSGQFKHYDLDRIFEAITSSGFASKNIDFEVFKRVAPYPAEFEGYLVNTVEWTRKYISSEARDRLDDWFRARGPSASSNVPSYFMEVDLVAWLS